MYYPKISIVTPSFNQAKFLEKTINSIISQNYPNLEYIIIDGGSNDGSIDIIKKYEKHLTFWISENDRGQSDALNKGFAKATGEIFAYLNSDDMYLPNTFEIIANSFVCNPNVDIIYGHSLIIDEHDNIIKKCIALPFRLNEYLNGVFSVPQQSLFWRKRVYEKIGGFNIENHTCMDGEFIAYAGAMGFKFNRLNFILSKFRIHTESKTGKKDTIIKKNYPKDQQKYIEIISKKLNMKVNKTLKLFYKVKYLPTKVYYNFRIK